MRIHAPAATAALLLALAGALAAGKAMASEHEGRFVERDGWTQFLPPWREGPANASYARRETEVPRGVAFATDGATWFYATDAPNDSLDEAPTTCGPEKDATVVVLRDPGCHLAKHPSVACAQPVEEICFTLSASAGTPPATFPLDSCGRVQHARCASAAPLAVVLLALGAIAALSAPWRGRGPS